MSISLTDLSSTTLDCLADLIEQRLEDPNAGLTPTTWHEAATRDDADRELVQALRTAGIAWLSATAGLPTASSRALH